jgi:SAM-dependent methyltransferase
MDFNAEYWTNRYKNNESPWDLGAVSPPLQKYIDSLQDQSLKILIPGGGNCYEIEYLYLKGFLNTYLLDISPLPIQNIQSRNPNIPSAHLLCGDFFKHAGTYDLILEQTFFCALNPHLRKAYVAHMHRLLKPGGKLVGLLFDAPLNAEHPPFGGNAQEYTSLFENDFIIHKMEPCANSIEPRAGRELFVEFISK